MSGGSITGNTFASFGGGVFVAAGGSMTMTGGSITGNSHRSYATSANDVAVYASSNGAGSLTMSGGARIEKAWLYYYSATYYGYITINEAFSGSDTVATLDLSANTTGRQILKGDAVASSNTRFKLEYYRTAFTNSSVTKFPTNYYIDTSGVLRN
jgi:hypothetical protein